jgi:WD repeat and SOF domain-containing protein 1
LAKAFAHVLFRNFDPEVHPFEKAREYRYDRSAFFFSACSFWAFFKKKQSFSSRAMTAVKMDKMFAKPFVRALSGHMEGVYSLAKHSTRLSCVISGACDGEIRIWNLASGSCNASIKHAHQGFVRGVTVTPSGEQFLSCGSDSQVHLWPLQFDVYDGFDIDARPFEHMKIKPLQSYAGDEPFYAVDHQYGTECFATVSSQLQIWDVNRSHPLTSISWGAETHNSVRWNHAERNVLASAASDRTVTLYDARSKRYSFYFLAVAFNSFSYRFYD